MLDWARRSRRFVEGVSENAFLDDERVQSAVLHALIVVGEAASRLSEDGRAAVPAIPWQEIRGMRNRLAHDYMGIDLDEVWRTLSRDVPALIESLEAALAVD